MQNPRQNEGIPIVIQENAGVSRANIPVRLGVPCPIRRCFSKDTFVIESPQTESRPVQARAIALWPDGSAKWLLVDFFADISAYSRETVILRGDATIGNDSPPAAGMSVRDSQDDVTVDTGEATFSIPKNRATPFHKVALRNRTILSEGASNLLLSLPENKRAAAVVDDAHWHETGPVRSTFLRNGRFIGGKNETLCRFSLYQTFFYGTALCSIDCVIHNPHAASHPGGMWDLGDPGSLFFNEWSLELTVDGAFDHIEWRDEWRSESSRSSEKEWVLYQDSSGLANWNSVNHIDKNRQSTVSFAGYRVYTGTDDLDVIREGGQAAPYLKLCTASGWIAGAVRNFWQNFPISLEAQEGRLKIGLFPNRPNLVHELQGGEKKRHTLFLEFGHPDSPTILPQMQAPLNVFPAPEWTESTRAIPWFTASEDEPVYRDYVANIITGPNSFFKKRNVIDEYGWRHFGDLYADHEAVHHQGAHAFVAHYNNQYDFIYGGIVHFLRTGESEWFELAGDLARHVIDIDIYHTDEDKAAYNHGQFWHTDHYKEAHTCTHRGYSRLNKGKNKSYGGGPSNENDYASGLLQYYYLTGDPLAKEAVIELAQWVMGMDDGARTIFAIFDDGPTGSASATVEADFQKPGRGAGNSLNTLLDAFKLTQRYSYLEKAEEFIRRCIHPADNIDALRLDDPEYRWSYLVFLQVLSKYLEMKNEYGASDAMYLYARDSLLHYARWMLANETPYKDVLNKVDLPTETWPAQDIRKNHVFHMAAKYAHPDEKPLFQEQAVHYFQRCLSDLLEFDTAYLTRPMVLLAVYGYIHAYFQANPFETVPYRDHAVDFGSPVAFIPQRMRFRRTVMANLKQSIKAAKQLIQPKLTQLIKR
jgi:hypothetical protein